MLALIVFAVLIVAWFALPGGASVTIETTETWTTPEAVTMVGAEA